MAVRLSRRSAVRALVASTVAKAASVAKAEKGQAAAPSGAQPGACTLTPQAVEGPFYFDPNLLRSDIAEDRAGTPTRLALRVLEAGSCAPIAGARVDVWHADAAGWYSGYDRQVGGASTRGNTFLRGTQITGADGTANFRTVYPGWYPGRTPHIHIKIFLNETTLVTGQMYLPDELSAKIYSTREPYAVRGGADTTNASDFLFRESARESGAIIMTAAEDASDIVASLDIAVDHSGDAARQGAGGFFRRIIGR